MSTVGGVAKECFFLPRHIGDSVVYKLRVISVSVPCICKAVCILVMQRPGVFQDPYINLM